MSRTHFVAVASLVSMLACSSATPSSSPSSTTAAAIAPNRAASRNEPSPNTSILQPDPAAPVLAPAAPPAVATLTPIVRDTSHPSAAVDALVRARVAEGEPGMAVLVMRQGRSVHASGYGLAELATGAPIDARTPFRLASVSKQFTAMIVMMLAERGALAYDDPIARFVPEVVAGHAGRRAVTIRQLLHHTSGIPDYLDLLDRQGVLDDAEVDTADVVRRIAAWRAHSFRAGTRYEYSNSNYVLLAAIAERASGQPFASLLRDRILRPLAMPTAIVFDDPGMTVAGRARGYDSRGGVRRGVRRFELDDSNSPVLGDDGIFASLEDFVRWEHALSSEQLVSRATLDLAFTSGQLRDGTETGYGFGWEVEGEGTARRIGHDGSWAGFRTAIVRAPDLGLTVVVLSNRGDIDADEVAVDVLGIFTPPHRVAGPESRTLGVCLPCSPALVARATSTSTKRDAPSAMRS